VPAGGQRLVLTVAHQRQTGLVRHEQPGLERHRLTVAERSRRLQPDLLELPRDIDNGLLEAVGTDIAAFELVIGQVLDVGPPALAFSGHIGEEGDGGCEQQISELHDVDPILVNRKIQRIAQANASG
jgi:hypothetical protein